MKTLRLEVDSFNQIPAVLYKNYGQSSELKDGIYTKFIDIAFDEYSLMIFRLHSQSQNGTLIGNRFLTVADLEGNYEVFELKDESGVRLHTNQGKLYILQRDSPDENSIVLNVYTFEKQ